MIKTVFVLFSETAIQSKHSSRGVLFFLCVLVVWVCVCAFCVVGMALTR